MTNISRENPWLAPDGLWPHPKEEATVSLVPPHAKLEDRFDSVFASRLALREKQLQQNYRPIIGVHKWFARRPGTLFRNLLLAEFNGTEPLERAFFHGHKLKGVIADPFMGGGTPLI